MPSGSHRCSPGGHSSGGSSMGGGRNSNNWGGGRNSSSSSRMSGNYTFHFFGKTYSTSHNNKITSTILSVLFLFIFFAIMGLTFLFDGKADIKVSKVDREYYLQMIEYAEEHPEFQKEGVVTGRFYNDDADKWYFEYAIDYVGTDGLIHELKGYTFSVYTFAEISEVVVGDRLIFAVNNKDVNELTDSINMDYKDIPLSADGTYVSAKTTVKVGIGCLIASCIILVIGIFAIAKTCKKELVEVATTKSSEKDKINSCEYCGRIFKDNETYCSSCGAARRYNK